MNRQPTDEEIWPWWAILGTQYPKPGVRHTCEQVGIIRHKLKRGIIEAAKAWVGDDYYRSAWICKGKKSIGNVTVGGYFTQAEWQKKEAVRAHA